MKNFVVLLLLVAVGVGFYVYLQDDASARIKTEMSGIIGEMQLPPEWKEEAKTLLAAVHEKAFEASLDITERLGRKFDDKTYYDKVFEMMQQRAADEGKTELAENLAQQKELFRLDVTEQ